jgi:hypothetical protein
MIVDLVGLLYAQTLAGVAYRLDQAANHSLLPLGIVLAGRARRLWPTMNFD